MGCPRKSSMRVEIIMVLIAMPLLISAFHTEEKYNDEQHEQHPESCGHSHNEEENKKGFLEKLKPTKSMEEFLEWDMSHLVMKNVAESAALKVLQTYFFADVEENVGVFMRSLVNIFFSPTGAERLQSCFKRWQCQLGRIIRAIPTGREIIRFVVKNYFPPDMWYMLDVLTKMEAIKVSCEAIPCDLST